MRPRHTLACLLTCLGLVVGVVGIASPASAATERKPCGERILRAVHAASADFYDYNSDRLECWPRAGSGREPGDNYRLNAPGYGPDTKKFYAWGGEETGISFLDRRSRSFGGWLAGQEDDPDFNDCRYTCYQRLHYDSNDYFYFATGRHGSVQRTMRYFEQHARGYARVTMVYSRLRAAHSVFSFESSRDARSAPRPVVHYRSCAGLNRVHRHGVGLRGAVDRTSGRPVRTFTRNNALYRGNNGPRNRATGEYDLDRDNDGIACEK